MLQAPPVEWKMLRRNKLGTNKDLTLGLSVGLVLVSRIRLAYIE